jgi:hypothetical protein
MSMTLSMLSSMAAASWGDSVQGVAVGAGVEVEVGLDVGEGEGEDVGAGLVVGAGLGVGVDVGGGEGVDDTGAITAATGAMVATGVTPAGLGPSSSEAGAGSAIRNSQAAESSNTIPREETHRMERSIVARPFQQEMNPL